MMILLPDEQIAAVYATEIEPNLKKGTTLAFAHGFNIHYGQVGAQGRSGRHHDRPQGARSPGAHRPTYRAGGCLHLLRCIRINRGRARDLALSYAAANGGTRGGVIETNFREETETDLFGEQVGAVRWFDRLDSGGLRNSDGSRVRAGDGLFRMPARSETDRRPDL